MSQEQFGMLLPVFLLLTALILCVWDWATTSAPREATRDRGVAHPIPRSAP